MSAWRGIPFVFLRGRPDPTKSRPHFPAKTRDMNPWRVVCLDFSHSQGVVAMLGGRLSPAAAARGDTRPAIACGYMISESALTAGGVVTVCCLSVFSREPRRFSNSDRNFSSGMTTSADKTC